jgi:hypothetical protein
MTPYNHILLHFDLDNWTMVTYPLPSHLAVVQTTTQSAEDGAAGGNKDNVSDDRSSEEYIIRKV